MRRVISIAIICISVQFSFAQKQCSQTEYKDELIRRFPGVQADLNSAELFLRNYRNEILSSGNDQSGSPIPIITIPVVIHILYKEASQNVSDERVRAQLETLNKAFQQSHSDTSKIPAHFRGLAVDARIQFCLAKIDPNGRATTGILRKNTWVTLYGIDDRIKYTDQGGSDAWDTHHYLNVWVGSLAGGIAGYSSLPGGPKDRDGVAVSPHAFGVANGGIYNSGKTLVHEVGHWLGLRHIWGDSNCGDDYIDDTPRQRTANRGCLTGIKTSCDNAPYGDMYMNYMDQTNDDCMFMFSRGQIERMRSAFAGPRLAMLSSNGCTGTPLPEPSLPPVEENQEIRSINLYPNPTPSQLVIDLKEELKLLGGQIIILNQFGHIVRRVSIGKLKTVVDVRDLRGGMYFIQLNSSNGAKYQEKFLKL